MIPLVLLAVAAAVAIGVRGQAVVPVLGGVGVALGVLLVVLIRVRRPRIGDWRDAEHAAARWLTKAGCRQVALTGASADGGLDVVTAQWAVQVKHTDKRVGRPVVQQVVGAALTVERHPAVVSTSGFTSPAFDYAEEHQVALLEMSLDGAVVRMNEPARHVGKRLRRGSFRR